MTKESNLSERICASPLIKNGVIRTDDVKEFIRKLKELVEHTFKENYPCSKKHFLFCIDRLIGDELI